MKGFTYFLPSDTTHRLLIKMSTHYIAFILLCAMRLTEVGCLGPAGSVEKQQNQQDQQQNNFFQINYFYK